jgi:hypothetical protein
MSSRLLPPRPPKRWEFLRKMYGNRIGGMYLQRD